ncbi:MFS transporter [Acetobacteraceae bacterium H6797]|nr:MFS transporter [Acetobacteraceae bacterium H6797]
MPATLLWLSLGTFATGTALFVIGGLLPAIAHDLGVSVATAGHLVTAYAIIMTIFAPLTAAATGAFERRRLLVVMLLGFAATNALAAMAPNFEMLLLARVAIALSVAGFLPVATGYALATTAPEKRGRAISMVVGGLTIATAAGAPIGSLVGEHLGWRAPFWAVAVVSLLAAGGIRWRLAPQPGVAGAGIGERLAVLREPGVVPILLQGALLIAGAFTLYTYFASFFHAVLGFEADGVAVAILAFGIGAVLGNPLGGYMADRWHPRKVLAWILGLQAVLALGLSVLPALFPASALTLAMLIIVLLWSTIGWAYSAPQQTRLVRIAPHLAPVLISFHGASTYLGSSLGALAGSAVLASGHVAWLGIAGAALELLALALLLSRREPAMRLAPAE